MASEENEDLYSSYVNNPYNITLQVDQNYGNPQSSTTTTVFSETNTVSVASLPINPVEMSQNNTNNSNIFQSINYFGAASDANIPPGSEMLFGNP